MIEADGAAGGLNNLVDANIGATSGNKCKRGRLTNTEESRVYIGHFNCDILLDSEIFETSSAECDQTDGTEIISCFDIIRKVESKTQ